MFLKCLKYDMRSVSRIWWLMAACVLGMSVVGGIALRVAVGLIEADRFPFLVFLGVLLVIACVLAIIASAVVTEILIYWRFYKNFFTDEGYLTFTLPVSRKTLLLSKTVNALIWTAAQVVLILVCVVLLVVLGIPAEAGIEALEGVLYGLSMIWAEVGAWGLIYAVEFLLLMLCGMLFSVSLIHFCITMGAMLAKKHKLLAAVGVYYVVNMAVSLVTQLLTIVFMFFIGGELTVLLSTVSVAMRGGIVALLLLIGCAMMASLACTMYFFMQTKLERNLNLA